MCGECERLRVRGSLGERAGSLNFTCYALHACACRAAASARETVTRGYRIAAHSHTRPWLVNRGHPIFLTVTCHAHLGTHESACASGSISVRLLMRGVCAMRAARACALSETFWLTGAHLNSIPLGMALKSAAVNANTPAERVAKAEQMLGKIVEPPKTRWNPGSLFGQALSLIDEPLVGFLTPSKLLVVGFATAAQASAAFNAISGAMPAGVQGTAADPGNGSLRSRVVDMSDFGISYVEPELEGPTYDALSADLKGLVESLALPARPTVTGSSLASKVDAYFQDREVPAGFTLMLSQFTGDFRISPASADGTMLDELKTAAGAFVVAEFDLAVPTAEPVTPETGPIFG